MMSPNTERVPPAEPRTWCEHRGVISLLNWVDDGEGGTKPDGNGYSIYCRDCQTSFEPRAQAGPPPLSEAIAAPGKNPGDWYSEGAAPRAEGLVGHALRLAWLDSNDAQGQALPPDLAGHLAARLSEPEADCPDLDGCRERMEGAAPRAEGLDVGLLVTALHTADPILDSAGVGHTPMCEERAEKIAAAYLREQRLRLSRPSDERVPESEASHE